MVDVIFCIKDHSGRYQAVNHAFVRRTGRSSKRDVLGRQASDFFAPSLAERYAEQDTYVLSTGKTLRDELELIRRENGDTGWYVTTKLPLDPTDDHPRPGLVSISHDLKTPRDDDADVLALARVIDHVRANLQRRMKVAELADVAGLTATQLDRRMKATFGVSPSKYVTRARVNRAAELLTETAEPLADVAVAAGFYDQANLTRQFARLTGETPAQFRSQHGIALRHPDQAP
ncbi:MAG: helix-turn-helix domain-containing protein [Actinomycetota bacterium]